MIFDLLVFLLASLCLNAYMLSVLLNELFSSQLLVDSVDSVDMVVDRLTFVVLLDVLVVVTDILP
jgi:hypothetical protein